MAPATANVTARPASGMIVDDGEVCADGGDPREEQMVGRPREVSQSVLVRSTPERVWALVGDPTAYATFSPENTGATVPGGGAPLQVGDRFDGRNRRGRFSWSTTSVVTASDPERTFAFRVEVWGLGTPRLRVANASWAYRLEPAPEGTTVTETWTDDRPWPDALAAVVDRLLTGGSTFAEFQRHNIATSLDRLRRHLEGTAA